MFKQILFIGLLAGPALAESQDLNIMLHRFKASGANIQYEHKIKDAVLKASKRYGLDARTILGIAIVESSLNQWAINTKTHDFGLMQVNQHNIRALKLDRNKLLNNIEYNIDSGARILSYFVRRYGELEGLCRYNVGTAPVLKPRQLKRCMEYIAKVQNWSMQ